MSERWLFHLVRPAELVWSSDDRYAPPSLATEGFLHASFKDAVRESARLYFAASDVPTLRVLAIDPRVLRAEGVRVDLADTPRGPMPHVVGALPRAAVTELASSELDAHPDVID